MTTSVDVATDTGGGPDDTEGPGDPRTQRGILRSVVHSPRGAVALTFLTVVIVLCALAPWIAPYDPLKQDFTAFKQLPSSAHWLGTDTLGRDVLSRLLYGGLVSLLAVVVAVVTRLLVGVPMGIAAGYLGGRSDRLITRVADIVMAIPIIVILLSVLTMFNRNLTVAMAALGILSSFSLMRIVRGSVLATREELYISASKVMGLSSRQIMIRHVLPRARGPIIVQTSLFAAIALGVQTGLTYLGLGPPPPAPTWGGMVGEAATVVESFPYLLLPTGGIIALTVLALGILGDVIRDATADQHSAHGGLRAPKLIRPATPAAPKPDEVLLSVQDLSVTFETRSGPTTVIQDVCFDVPAGATVGLVGESGSGKTVTARAILGLLPGNGAITQGCVSFAGGDLSRMTHRQLSTIRGKRIAMIAQEPMLSLDPSFRIGAQLAEIVRIHDKCNRRTARHRVIELLETVQIPDPEEVARRYPHEVSGGMAQRVVIAMALAGRPDLLIADEPTTALDVTVQAEILDLLRTLRDQQGMAIILVTHDWGVVADLCDQVVVMYAGQVVETATIDELFTDPKHPYTAALLASSPERGPGNGRMKAIPGSVPAPHEWPTGCHFAARCSFATAECRTSPIPILDLGDNRSARCVHPGAVTTASKRKVLL